MTKARVTASGYRFARSIAIALLTVTVASGCGQLMAMLHGGPDRPPQSEFGLGPRPTAGGLYSITLEPVEPLVTRKLQKVRVRVLDAAGQPADVLSMSVDGGMPQHGHGLPTRPRMTGRTGTGSYEIDGVRFNMGGWWEFKLAVTTQAGTDSVTFNLDL